MGCERKKVASSVRQHRYLDECPTDSVLEAVAELFGEGLDDHSNSIQQGRPWKLKWSPWIDLSLCLPHREMRHNLLSSLHPASQPDDFLFRVVHLDLFILCCRGWDGVCKMGTGEAISFGVWLHLLLLSGFRCIDCFELNCQVQRSATVRKAN